ncbi:MAG: tetratricopeptide repeat protein [Candidatus Omnitrophota bacterium]
MKKLTLFLIILVFPTIVNADAIYLKGGQKIEGKFLNTTSEYIKIDFYGVELTYFLDEIDHTDMDEKPTQGHTSAFERKIKGLSCTTMDEVLELSEEEIDIATALLIISKESNNTINIIDYRNEIDSMVLELSRRIRGTKDPRMIIETMNSYLFDSIGFKPRILKDYVSGSNPETSFLSNVLDRKEGDCEGLSGLYLSLSERLTLPIYGVSLPAHKFVRYTDGITSINIEMTDRGEVHSDEEYIEYYNLPGKTSFKIQSKKDFIIDHIIKLGTFWGYIKNPDKAIFWLEKALEINPQSEHAHNSLGLAYREKGLISEAISKIKKAIEINSTIADFYYNLGSIYDREGMKDEAIAEYNKGLKIAPSPAIYCFLGNIYATKDMLDESIMQYKCAIELDPNYGDAHCFIADCYRRKGEYNLAWQHARIAQKLGQPLATYEIEELNKVSSEPSLKE